MDSTKITEDISAAWFDQKNCITHPFDAETKPYASGTTGNKYSWVKAPRYDGLPTETGPLAETIMDGIPLFQDMIQHKGASALVRQLARITRASRLLPAMGTWLNELLTHRTEPFYTSVKRIPDGQGVGMIQAARGALGHWVSIKNKRSAITRSSLPRPGTVPPGCWHESRPLGGSLKGLDLKRP